MNKEERRKAVRQKYLAEAVDNLKINHISRHIFLCCDQTKPNCCDKERSLEAWAFLKRRLDELVEYLFRDNHHPHGCLFLTGTGIVPDDDVTLVAGDVVEISISGIGTLINPVE